MTNCWRRGIDCKRPDKWHRQAGVDCAPVRTSIGALVHAATIWPNVERCGAQTVDGDRRDLSAFRAIARPGVDRSLSA